MSLVRGWCPDLFNPMRSGDGLLLRIKPVFGRMEAGAVIALSRSASRLGNDIVEITNRGNLQFRGFSEHSAALFAAEALSLGLAHADPGMERRRNILVSPLAGDDPACAPDTRTVAQILSAALIDDAFAHLPDKFGFLVDGGGMIPLSTVTADIALRASAEGWRVECGGLAVTRAATEAAGIALQLALACNKGQRPARDPACAHDLWQRAGHRPDPIPPMTGSDFPPITIGSIGLGLFGVGAPPGQLTATGLRIVAELSTRLGDSVLRITPFRSVLMGGLPAETHQPIVSLMHGLLIDPADPRLRTAACIGRPGCARSTVATVEDAARFASSVPPGALLHVSGCEKGCAHPGAALVTLVGRDGRYDLVREGRAGDAPVLCGIEPGDAAGVIRSLASP